jgi:hypothetical protein
VRRISKPRDSTRHPVCGLTAQPVSGVSTLGIPNPPRLRRFQLNQVRLFPSGNKQCGGKSGGKVAALNCIRQRAARPSCATRFDDHPASAASGTVTQAFSGERLLRGLWWGPMRCDLSKI